MNQCLLELLCRAHSCEVNVGGETCELRILSAREVLALRHELAECEIADEAQRALQGNAVLLSRALYRGGESVFNSAEELLDTLSVGEVNALIGRYAVLDGAVNPSAEDGRKEIETLKKA